jgi:hypothetical protein
MSFSNTFGEDLSFEMPQCGIDASISRISDNVLRLVNHEATVTPVAGIDRSSLFVEDLPGSANWTPLQSTRTSNIKLKHNISHPSYEKELGSEHEEMFATVERNLFTESDHVAGPDDLRLPIAQAFIGHENDKQTVIISKSTDLNV